MKDTFTPRTDPSIDAASAGDPARFLPLAALERAFAALPPPPQERGRLAAIVRRVGTSRRREVIDRVVLTPEGGVQGDAWGRQERPSLDAQIAVMRHDVATLVANGQPLSLFGDSLFLDLEIGAANLPAGSRLRIGDAVLEVTPMPHNGCRKFNARFGADALRLVNEPALRHHNLRGIYLRVVEAGEARAGDAVTVIRRGGAA